MDLHTVHRVYFIGIGGIGMSALARYFKFLGKNVAGYDKTETPLTQDLSKLGIPVHYTDDLAMVPKPYFGKEHTLVVYTPAVPASHAGFQYFVQNGFTVKKRSEVLGMITRDSFCFAVAGTHGKTTTSCILAHLLKETGTPFTAFLGGISEDFKSNFVLEGTEYSVVEADEFDRSFLQLSPNVACITSMDADHLDIYGSKDQLEQSFVAFSRQLKSNGKLFVHSTLPIEGIRYGIEDGSTYCIQHIRVDKGRYIFDLVMPGDVLRNVTFNKPGRHNLLNALVAFAMALETGAAQYRLAEALGTFKGVQRRFSYRIKNESLVFIDDYAHHPTEIDAVYEAIAEMHPGKRTLAVFQPHLYSRTKDFAEGFAHSLSRFDDVLLLDIYPAREEPMAGVTSKWLLEKMTNKNKMYIQKEELIQEITKRRPEVLVAMGAGDIGLEIDKIKNHFDHAQ